MTRALHTYVGAGFAIATDVSALALPPPDFALVADPDDPTSGLVTGSWNVDGGTVPEFELEIWADGARALTDATLFGAHLHDLAFADTTVTADATTNALAAVAHARLTGDGPVRIASLNGTVPGGIVATVASRLALATVSTHADTVVAARDFSLGEDGDDITVELIGDAGANAGTLVESGTTVELHYKPNGSTVTNLEALIAASTIIQIKTAGTGATVLTGVDATGPHNLTGGVTGDDYYVATVADADHLQLAETRVGAMEGDFVDLTTAGSGTIKLVDVPATPTERVHWHSHGLLGLLDDGAIDLTNQKSYMVRCRHTPRAFAYAIVATFGAGAGLVSSRVYPVREL